ncbi:unnamed protein product [Linum tenue]|uniref:RRM domain-containing protein n=1 Tax=Linum tenue TaxID=586396 RepID=A0AAV0ILP4_9ROSI|nr:unnamed protein product [Linum tenue]
MPTEGGNASAVPNQGEPIDSDERIDLNEDNDPEEAMDEEVEYEEVEEEEEVEEYVEEEIEVEEEGEESDNDNNDITNHGGGTRSEYDDEKKKHDELLALPPHGSEVYIGGIPHDTTQEELRGFCESVGDVHEVRMMKGKNLTDSKIFAFVTFTSVDLASKAIKELNNSEFKGSKLKCSTSQAKHRLFLGNIPRSWGEEELRKAVTEVGPGVNAIQLVKDPRNISNNRGFGFLEYHNNACAEYSRQKMSDPKFKLGDNTPTVSWADSRSTNSAAGSLLQVKALYVKNLPKDVTQDQLKNLFDCHGQITKVVLPPAKLGQENNRIGFVHFADRSSAMKALNSTEKYELNGNHLYLDMLSRSNRRW